MSNTEQSQKKYKSLSARTYNLQNRLANQSQTEERRKHWDIYKYLYDPYFLAEALKLVLSNKGSAGVDRVTVESLKGIEWDFCVSLSKKIRDKRYTPSAVRRVYIPKQDGRKRPLGIPTIEDRVVQRALVLLMEPIYEQRFLPCSYGFRPNQRAQTCVAEMAEAVYKHRYVLEADIEGFFDNVDHKLLLKMIKKEIVDTRVLKLIRSILKAGFMETKKPWEPTLKGTPQGGPLSPLLANIYLHYGLDERFKALNTSYVKLYRYADDFVIVCKKREDVQALKKMVEVWMGEVGLRLKAEKTKIVDMRNSERSHASKFDFLGFKIHLRSFRDNPKRFWIARQPSEKARKNLNLALKKKLSPQLKLTEAKKMAESVWRGWGNYFRYGNASRIFFRQVRSVKRALIHYLRQKYRKTRRPIPWRKLLKLFGFLARDIRPIRSIPDSFRQKQQSMLF